MVKRRCGEVELRRTIKNHENNDFQLSFLSSFLPSNAQNSLLLIEGERRTSCLYWEPTLALDSNKKDLNC